MRYWLRTTYLALFILFSSFQCSRWTKYAEDIILEINPSKLTIVNDSIKVSTQASMGQELAQKTDSVRINFYYLAEDDYSKNNNDEIGSILLTPNQRSQSEQFKFKYIKGKSLYAKQIIRKNNAKVESPLLLVAEPPPPSESL